MLKVLWGLLGGGDMANSAWGADAASWQSHLEEGVEGSQVGKEQRFQAGEGEMPGLHGAAWRARGLQLTARGALGWRKRSTLTHCQGGWGLC